MNKLALFLAGLLLGLFFGRFYPLAHAPLRDPFSVHVPDNDETWPLCEEEVATIQLGHESRQLARASLALRTFQSRTHRGPKKN